MFPTQPRSLARLVLGVGLFILSPTSPAGAARPGPLGRVLPRPSGSSSRLRSAEPGAQAVGRPDSGCRPVKNRLAYHGGALVTHPDVFLLFWGSAWTSDPVHLSAKADLENLYQKLVTSEYACAWQEYGVPGYALGTGSYAGSYVIASNPGNPVTDASIQARIEQEVMLGHAPPRTDDTVYVVVTPDGFPVDGGDGTTGCGGSNFQFCAYHWYFHSGGSYRYEVLPFPCSTGEGTCFVDPSEDVNAAFETAASHELTELVTDPDDPGGWYSDRDGQENADICASDSCIFDVTIGGDTFATNSTWSNLARGCVGTVACPVRPIGCTDPAPGACSAGSGKTGACELEWQVDPNLTQKKGITTGNVTCSDGLPFCDADGMSDGTCTFHVAACLNNSDPRLASCSLQPIDSIEVRAPKLPSPAATTLLATLASIDPGSIGTVAGDTVSYSPAASSGDSCSGYLDIAVPSGKRLTLSAAITTPAGRAASKVKLSCR